MENPYNDLPLTCPRCCLVLTLSPDCAVCSSCNVTYPRVFHDIFDLRYPTPTNEKSDSKVIELLIQAYPHSSFRELAQLLFENLPGAIALPEKIKRSYEHYFQTNTVRGQIMALMFQRRVIDYQPQKATVEPGTCALDLGCGSGASLQVLSQRYSHVVGLDPELYTLLLAHKNLSEKGIRNVQLVQAYGQHIPFEANTFEYISALNVLEHVLDVDQSISEINRTLRPGGCFVGDSRNRFDVFFTEPHTKLHWVGMLPRKYAPGYVRWRTGIEYNHTYLLSYFDLHRSFNGYFNKRYKIIFPDVEAYGGPGWFNRITHRLEEIPPLASLALLFFPSHLVVAQK